MEKGDLITAVVLAAALFFIFVVFGTSEPIPEDPHIIQGLLNTSMQHELSNQTYLKVFYSPSCPACRKQLPELYELAKGGTFIQLIDVYQYSEEAVREDINATPTTFVIGPLGMERNEGYLSKDKLLEAIGMVSHKNTTGIG